MSDHSTSSARKLAYNKSRRQRLKLMGYCINGQSHGTATHGVLCLNCRKTHKKTR